LGVNTYKGDDDAGWILEILDGYGNSTSADEQFATKQQAWDQFITDIKNDGIDTFITPT
jgi:hypothetical protein